MAEKNRPEVKYRAGGVTATVWKNTVKKNDKDVEVMSVTFERSYQDKEGNWQTTNSLQQNDIPKGITVLQKAFDFIVLKTDQQKE